MRTARCLAFIVATAFVCGAPASAEAQTSTPNRAGQRGPVFLELEGGYHASNLRDGSSAWYWKGFDVHVIRPMGKLGSFRTAIFVGAEWDQRTDTESASGSLTSSSTDISDKNLVIPLGIRFEERLAKRAPIVFLDARSGLGHLSTSDTTTITLRTSQGATQTVTQSSEDSQNGLLLGADIGFRKEMFYFSVGYDHFFYSNEAVNAFEIGVGINFRWRGSRADGAPPTGATPGAGF